MNKARALGIAVGVLIGASVFALGTVGGWMRSAPVVIIASVLWACLVAVGFWAEVTPDEVAPVTGTATFATTARVREVRVGVLLQRGEEILLACGHSIDLAPLPREVREHLAEQSSVPCRECSRGGAA